MQANVALRNRPIPTKLFKLLPEGKLRILDIGGGCLADGGEAAGAGPFGPISWCQARFWRVGASENAPEALWCMR